MRLHCSTKLAVLGSAGLQQECIMKEGKGRGMARRRSVVIWSVLGGCGGKKNVYNVVIASERRSHTGLAAKIED